MERGTKGIQKKMKKYFWKLGTEIYLGLKILLCKGGSRKHQKKVTNICKILLKTTKGNEYPAQDKWHHQTIRDLCCSLTIIYEDSHISK